MDKRTYWIWADKEALLFQAWQAGINSHAKSEPVAWLTIDKNGQTKVWFGLEPTKLGGYTWIASPDEFESEEGLDISKEYAKQYAKSLGFTLDWYYGVSKIPFYTAPQQADKVRELEKDAARYRWLRNKANHARKSEPMVCLFPLDNQKLIDGEELDIAIDEAMKGE